MPEQKSAIDPSLKTGLLSLIETAVNKTLTLDPVTIKRLKEHQGAVLKVECREPDFTSWLWIESDGIRLAGYHEGEVDATVSGTLVSFMELSSRRSATFEDVAGLATEGDESLIAELGMISTRLWSWIGKVWSAVIWVMLPDMLYRKAFVVCLVVYKSCLRVR